MFENRRVQVDTTWNMTSLALTRTERQDAGEYSVTLENQHGAATLKANVIVVGKCVENGMNLLHVLVHVHK